MNLKTLLYLFSTNKVTHCYDVDHKPVGLTQDEWNRIIKSHKYVCGFKKIPFKYLKNEDKQNVIKYAVAFVHKNTKKKKMQQEWSSSCMIKKQGELQMDFYQYLCISSQKKIIIIIKHFRNQK